MKSFNVLLAFAVGLFTFATAQGLCTSKSSPKREVVCFYEGKRSTSDLDVCHCTHLIYLNVGIEKDGRIDVTSDIKNDLSDIRSANPDLKLLISLGGISVSELVFRSTLSSVEGLANFTSSVSDLREDHVIDGIEIDWEYPAQDGDKKDKIKLVKLARQIKMAVGEELIGRKRFKRETDSFDDYLQIPKFKIPLNLDQETAAEAIERSSTTTTTTSTTSSTTTTTTTSEQEASSTEEVESKVGKENTEEAHDVKDDEALKNLETLVDLYLDEQEEEKEEGKFLIFVRLAPKPEFLVKGYDFKMLDKYVDYYILPSHNLSLPYNNVTFHHSRLMGVSDIENADSLIDVLISLGVSETKLILTATAFGNSFSLENSEKTLPGSTALAPQRITYQQVCKALQKGNWTLEREEDQTGPYAFNDKTWMAYDDIISLRIKAKYAILRNLGGVGLFAVDADDIDDICGKGSHSLLNSLYNTMDSLDRKPRQLVVHSLEEDLFAQAQTFSPVSTAVGGLNLSPFRIVRIVDRDGRITSVRENSETVLECTRQGYYRDPQDCSRFYRCVKFNQYDNDYTIFEYGCPAGLIFDDRWEVCVWPSQATPCDGSSEINPVPKEDYSCPAEGFFVDPENCRWFFACLDHEGDGTYTHYEFRCPFGLAFDEEYLICNWPWLVPACGGTRGSVLPSRARQQKAFGGSGRHRRPLGGFAGGRRPGQRVRPNGFPGSGAFKSDSPARQPTSSPNYRVRQRVTAPTHTAAPVPTTPYNTVRPSNEGLIYGEIVSDSCDNCESPSLFVFGNGHSNGAGIEVAAGFQEPRRPKVQNEYQEPAYQEPGYQSPTYRPVTTTYRPVTTSYRPATTAAPAYNPSTTRAPAYNPSTTRVPAYNPSTTRAPAYNPSTTRAPAYNPSTTRAPAYSPSTTRAPAYNPTTASYNPSSYSPSSYQEYPEAPGYNYQEESGYNYPTPSNPLVLPERRPSVGIAVSNPGEHGLRPSYNEPINYSPQPTTPNTTPYSPSTYAPTTPAPTYPSTTRRPTYPSTTVRPTYPSTTRRPTYPSTTVRPTYPSTTRRPTYPSTTRRPTYQPTSYSPAPSYESTYEPSYESDRKPAYQSTTSRPYQPSFEAHENEGYNYPVPNNPLELPTRRPAYEASRAPAYQVTTPRPSYPSSTKGPIYQPTSPQYQPTSPQYQPTTPAYNPTTARPYQPPSPRPTYQEENESGYVYNVPSNPLELPERRPKNGPGFSNNLPNKSNFRAPEIDYSGFKPPYVPDLPSERPNYQEPNYQGELVPGRIEYGFKPSYNNPSPRPNYQRPGSYEPQEPRQPPKNYNTYEQAPRQPKQNTEQRPYKPDYSDQTQPAVFTTVTSAIYDFVSTTIAPYVPAFTTPKPAPPPPAPKRPNPYPGDAEVASVIPSGFTSATLSNGPHSLPASVLQGGRGVNSHFTNVHGSQRPLHTAGKAVAPPRPGPIGDGVYSGVPRAPIVNSHSSLSSGNYQNRPSVPKDDTRYTGRPLATQNNRPSIGSGRPRPIGNGGYNGRPGPNGNGGYNGKPGPNGNGGYNGRPGPIGNGGYNGRPGPIGNGGYNGRPGPNGNGGYNGKPGPNGNGGYNGRPGPNGNGGYNGRPGPNGNGGYNGRPGPNGIGGYNGRPGPNGNGGYNGRPGPNGNGGYNGRPGPNGNGGYNGRPGPNGNGGYNGRPGPNGNGGYNGRPGPNGNGGYNGRPGPNGNGGYNGRPGPNGNGGYNGRPGPNGNGGYNGGRGRPRPNGQAIRGGRQHSKFKGSQSFKNDNALPNRGLGFTAIPRPAQRKPAILDKFTGSTWNKYGPGGYRNFNDTLGPEVCERPGLFRHPTDCDKFYECYWDKWVERYTLHVFPCPIVLGYDSGITACNWPFDGPQCQGSVK